MTDVDQTAIEREKALLERACDITVYDSKLARRVAEAVARLGLVEEPAARESLHRFARRLLDDTQARISDAQASWTPKVGEQAPLPGRYAIAQLKVLVERLGAPAADCLCAREGLTGDPSSHGHLSPRQESGRPATRTTAHGTLLEIRRYVCDFCGQVWRVERERGYDRDRIRYRHDDREP